jgi:hypothetical protein
LPTGKSLAIKIYRFCQEANVLLRKDKGFSLEGQILANEKYRIDR